jgi:predicted DNA-binding protein
MAYGKQLPIRLDPETEARLDAAAASTGTSKSALIRLLAKSFVEQCVSESGAVTLPPDWHALLPQRDGRTHRYSGAMVQEVRGDNNTVSQKKKSTSTTTARTGGGAKKARSKKV